jgi:hypothetical protein
VLYPRVENLCLQRKVTKGANINGEYYLNERINVDKKELFNLQDDMKELSNLLKIVTCKPWCSVCVRQPRLGGFFLTT